MTRELVCIQCPVGCRLTVTLQGDVVSEVKGNECKRGLKYAQDECVAPMRLLTTTVRVRGSAPVAVRSTVPIAKSALRDAVGQLKKMTFPAGCKAGDILIPDFLGLGADIVATQDERPI